MQRAISSALEMRYEISKKKRSMVKMEGKLFIDKEREICRRHVVALV
jgi:hypothetical protein